MPYGLDLFTYDKQVSPQKLQEISKQFDAIQTGDSHIAVFMHKNTDSKMVEEVLMDRRYVQMVPFFWVKPGQTMAGPVKCYTPAAEIGTIGFHPERNKVAWNVSEDPTLRHNIISCPSVRTLARNNAGEFINITEKPPEISQWLVGNHCSVGSTVLVIGPGAGGEVLGICAKGLNVVGVEVDAKMYQGLEYHLNARVAHQKSKMEEEEKKKKKQQHKEEKSGASASPSSLTDGAPFALRECTSCGEKIDLDVPDLKCELCETSGFFHPNCLEEVEHEGKNVKLCDACMDKNYPSENACSDNDSD